MPNSGGARTPLVLRNVLTGETTPIPHGCEVMIGEGHNAIYISATDKGEVEARGMNPLAILPHVSNVVTIRIRDRLPAHRKQEDQ